MSKIHITRCQRPERDENQLSRDVLHVTQVVGRQHLFRFVVYCISLILRQSAHILVSLTFIGPYLTTVGESEPAF